MHQYLHPRAHQNQEAVGIVDIGPGRKFALDGGRVRSVHFTVNAGCRWHDPISCRTPSGGFRFRCRSASIAGLELEVEVPTRLSWPMATSLPDAVLLRWQAHSPVSAATADRSGRPLHRLTTPWSEQRAVAARPPTSSSNLYP